MDDSSSPLPGRKLPLTSRPWSYSIQMNKFRSGQSRAIPSKMASAVRPFRRARPCHAAQAAINTERGASRRGPYPNSGSLVSPSQNPRDFRMSRPTPQLAPSAIATAVTVLSILAPRSSPLSSVDRNVPPLCPSRIGGKVGVATTYDLHLATKSHPCVPENRYSRTATNRKR